MKYDCISLFSLLISVASVQGHVLETSSLLEENKVAPGVYSSHPNPERQFRSTSNPAVVNRPFDTTNIRDHRIESFSNGRFRRSLNTSMTAGYDWNSVVDIIFSITQRDILAQGKDRIMLPDAVNEFEKKYSFLNVKGQFSAKEGTLSNLTDFRRSGDVSVVKKNGIYEMTCVLSLENLKMRYEKYELKMFGVRVRGSLEGAVTSNTVTITLTFAQTDEGCSSTLQTVNLTDLVGLKVTLSGLGEFNGVASAVASWLVEQREKDIVAIIISVLKREIEQALAEFQCDEYAILLGL